MKTFATMMLLSGVLFLSSCKKENVGNCGPASNMEIATNSPVIEGWPLSLSTTATSGSLFRWIGPNAFDINYVTYSSDANLQGKLVTTLADAGTYKVQLRSADGCIEYEGSTVVEIIKPPLPACNVANNSSISNVIGVGGVSYNSIIYFHGGGGIFTVQTSAAGETITFNFNGDNTPKPGVYKTSGYFAMDENTVGCYITNFPYDFINTSGQDVFVNKINGKTQVSFCNAIFTNPLGSAPIKISAKIVEP